MSRPLPGSSDDSSFHFCGVCGGEHDCGLGYSPDGKRPVMWTCMECIEVAEKVYGAASIHRNRWGQEARDMSLHELGSFLEKIGKSDFYEFTQDEARDMADLILTSFKRNLKTVILAGEAPF